MYRSVLVFAFAALLAGCSSGPRKQYIEPQGEAAQECVSECGVNRTRCRARAYDLYELCQQEYRWRERQHAACVRQVGTFCIKPERCRPPQTNICNDQYDGCFQACGGIIESDPQQ